MKQVCRLWISVLALGFVTDVVAQGAAPASAPTPVARGPSLRLAQEAAQAALENCGAREQKAAVSVVDSAGVLKVLLATDGASPRGVRSSTAKAVTALAYKIPTSVLSERIKTDKKLADEIAANADYNARAGGVLLTTVEGEIIGAIGVGGARGSEVDEACGLAGLQKIREHLH